MCQIHDCIALEFIWTTFIQQLCTNHIIHDIPESHKISDLQPNLQH